MSDKFKAIVIDNQNEKFTKEKKERFGSRQKQILLAKERGEKHLGEKQTK